MLNRFQIYFQVLSGLFFIILSTTTVQAENTLWLLKPFFGEFRGMAHSSEQEADDRLLKVNIYPTGADSFHIQWETKIEKMDGRTKYVKQSIEFQQSARDRIYSSAMRKNLFGKWQPLNPMRGDPYIWAKLEDGTFYVYALIITENGGYEMQQYERKIEDDGTMTLIFKRIRDGIPLKTITGNLMRVK